MLYSIYYTIAKLFLRAGQIQTIQRTAGRRKQNKKLLLILSPKRVKLGVFLQDYAQNLHLRLGAAKKCLEGRTLAMWAL